ncbi:MAG: c-type cytochrome [Desulfosalsimonas sp.]
MKKRLSLSKICSCLFVLVFLAGVFLLAPALSNAGQSSKKKASHQEAFGVYSQNCLSCHDSVADPEKPGRTRDDWHLVVNIMHGYGLELSNEQSEMIIDLLYDLRQGLEKEAG